MNGCFDFILKVLSVILFLVGLFLLIGFLCLLISEF